jgi:outer membrane protein assembly factor BamB
VRKRNDPRTGRRMQAVRRYRHALERGDLAVVAAVLGKAKDDPALEAMLLQVDRLAQAQESITVPADQLLQARRFLSMLREEAYLGSNDEVLDSSKDPLMTVPGKQGTIQKGKGQNHMLKELSPTPLDAKARRKAAPRITRFPRATGFLQTAAAILLVGALIAGFLLVFSMRSGAPRQATQTGAQSSAPPGIYISRSDGVYRYDIQTRKVIWHTHVAGQALFAGDPVIIGDTLYIVTDSWVSALNAQTGTLRWSHDFQGRVTDPYLEKGLLYFRTIPPLPAALYAVNPANGTITATYTPIQVQKSWAIPTVVVDGLLYYVAESTPPVQTTALYAVQLPGKKIVWQRSIHMPLIAPQGIIMQNGIVYVQILQESSSDQGLIEAFDAHTGAKLWQSPALARGLRVVTVTKEMLYAASFGGELLAFNSHTHALVWQKSFNTYVILAVSGVLYVEYGPDIGGIAALNATTGKLIWQQSKSDGLGLDSVVNGVVYGESWSNDGKGGTIYAFNASNGTQLWTMPTGVPNVQWGGMVVA